MNTNYKENNNNKYDVLPEGDYEAIITSASSHVTPNGAESIQFRLSIRNDLDKALPETNGKYHNRVLFHNEWKRKATGQYDDQNLQYYMAAVDVPEGVEIKSEEEFYGKLFKKPVRVHVEVEESEYKGKMQKRNVIKPWNFKKTEFPVVNHKFKDGSQMPAPADEVKVEPSKLPF